MGKIVTVDLTGEEFASLSESAVDKTEPRIAKRAQVVLCAAAGLSLKEIAARVGLGWQSCLKWRKRFLEHREAGLYDGLREGRPLVFDAKKQQVVINTVLFSAPQAGSSHWSFRKLASANGLSKSTIHRVLNELFFKPQKVGYWHDKISATVFKSQMPDFLGFHFSISVNAVAFSLCDDRFVINCLKYPVKGKELKHHADNEFWNFLERLRGLYRHDEIYVIVNNYDPYKHDGILEWASKQKRLLKLYFTPPRFSWHQQVNEVLGHYDTIKDKQWHLFEEDLLRRLRHELNDGELRVEPYEWMYRAGRELLPIW